MKENKLLSNLLNEGKLPEVAVSLSRETFISLAFTIVLSAIIIILVNAIIKSVFLNG